MKSMLSIALALAVTSFVNAADHNITEIEGNFSAARVVPDVLSSVDFKLALDLKFPSSNNGDITRTGLNVSQPVTSFLPTFTIHGAEASVNLNSTFVVVCVDPDAPTPQNRSLSEVLHYMGGGHKASGNAEQGFTFASTVPAVMPYTPPAPPNTSDAHRYVWLVYESTNGFANQTLVNPNTNRLGFNLQSFASSVGFAAPLGGTFFFVSTNPSQVGTSTGLLATPTTTATATTRTGGASRIHLSASVLIVPLVALLL